MPSARSSAAKRRGRHRRLHRALVYAIGPAVWLLAGCGEDTGAPLAKERTAEHVIDVTISSVAGPKLLSASAERLAVAQAFPIRFGNHLLVQRDDQDQIVDRAFIELDPRAVAFGFDRQLGLRCPCETKQADLVTVRIPRAATATRLELL